MIDKRLNYIGSKYNLLEFIHTTIEKSINMPLNEAIFCDMFSGSGVVSRYFSLHVKQIISNDLEYYSYVLAQNYLNTPLICKDKTLYDELNQLEGVEGFIYEHYSEASTHSRLYFSVENAKKIDAIRLHVESLYHDKKITVECYHHLLGSLIESADKIANTASVYSAYLKKLKKTAEATFKFIPSNIVPTTHNHAVYNENANQLIHSIQGDILYLDPPYNIRQYGSNYHILNTIAKYDDFVPKGITGVRDYTRSAYCSKKYVYEELTQLISDAKFTYIFMSYSSDGILHSHEIKTIFERFGKYSVVRQNHHRFKAQSKRKYASITEYIHILVKD